MVYPNLSNHTNWIDFYVTGGTLQIDARCYITRQADDDLYVGLTRRNFCYVLTSRQIGKSSLIVRTAMRLREGGSAVAVLDLTAIGQNLTVEQWYDGLLVQMGQELSLADELEAYWLDHKRQSPLQRWMHAIREVVLTRLSTPVIIFIDEIDFVRSLPFSTDEFFSAIRALHNSRTIEASLNRLTFCLSGVVSPGDLIRDTHTTPFNLGQRVELTDFTREEAVVFAQGLGRGVDIASSLLDRVFYWTNGHPYLTQQL